MKITVRTPDVKGPIIIFLPTRLLFSKILWKKMKNQAISHDHIRKIQKVLRDYRKTYGKLSLVEVDADDGTTVRITI